MYLSEHCALLVNLFYVLIAPQLVLLLSRYLKHSLLTETVYLLIIRDCKSSESLIVILKTLLFKLTSSPGQFVHANCVWSLYDG